MVAGQAWVVLYRRNHIGIGGSLAIGIDGRLWIGTGGGFQSEWVSGSEWNMQTLIHHCYCAEIILVAMPKQPVTIFAPAKNT